MLATLIISGGVHPCFLSLSPILREALTGVGQMTVLRDTVGLRCHIVHAGPVRSTRWSCIPAVQPIPFQCFDCASRRTGRGKGADVEVHISTPAHLAAASHGYAQCNQEMHTRAHTLPALNMPVTSPTPPSLPARTCSTVRCWRWRCACPGCA